MKPLMINNLLLFFRSNRLYSYLSSTEFLFIVKLITETGLVVGILNVITCLQDEIALEVESSEQSDISIVATHMLYISVF